MKKIILIKAGRLGMCRYRALSWDSKKGLRFFRYWFSGFTRWKPE